MSRHDPETRTIEHQDPRLGAIRATVYVFGPRFARIGHIAQADKMRAPIRLGSLDPALIQEIELRAAEAADTN